MSEGQMRVKYGIIIDMQSNKYSKYLRKNSTLEEKRLWNILRNRQFHNLKFRRQYPIDNYIVDFACLEEMLVIELDGGQHNEEKNIEYDSKRTEYLNSKGYRVLRFWNNDIFNNIDGVLCEIENYLNLK